MFNYNMHSCTMIVSVYCVYTHGTRVHWVSLRVNSRFIEGQIFTVGYTACDTVERHLIQTFNMHVDMRLIVLNTYTFTLNFVD